LLAIVGLWSGGCTSDDPNPVGTGIPGDIDLNDLQVLRITGFGDWGSVVVPDPDKGLAGSEMLYLGDQNGYRSSILAWYAFRDSIPDTYPVELDSIQEIRLRLFLSKAYNDSSESVRFDVYSLPDTFSVGDYPGFPPVGDVLIGTKTDVANVVNITLGQSWLVDHWNDNTLATLMIRTGADDSETLLAYGSRDLQLFTEIDKEIEETILGVTVTVDFEDELGYDSLTIAPHVDMSTFEEYPGQATSPEDGFLLRTHRREYPWFTIDLGDLPDHALVNRAVLRMGIDPEASFGPPQSLVLSQLPYSLVAGRDTLDFTAMVDSLILTAGLTTVDPVVIATLEKPMIGFDVTALIQRAANGVIEGEFTFILTAGEDQFPGYDSTLSDPEFYLTDYRFYGTAHPDYAPTIEITYTVFAEGGK